MVVLFFGHCVRWVTRPYGCGMVEVPSVVMRLFDSQSQSRQRQRILSSSALVTVENGAGQVGKKLCSVFIAGYKSMVCRKTEMNYVGFDIWRNHKYVKVASCFFCYHFGAKVFRITIIMREEGYDR